MQAKQLKNKDIPEIREKILKEQKGICPICEEEVNAPCLDHEHVKKIRGSGQIRGVICRNCNIFIAKAENNSIRCGVKIKNLPKILRNIADYLEKQQYPYIHPTEAPKVKQLKKTSYKKLKKVYDKKRKFPPYPKSKKLTKELSLLFKEYNIKPEYYKN